jgi:hypothetical protein
MCHQSWIMTPWRMLCVDIIGTYTLKGKDSTSIAFMCLTLIDPATSWSEIVELPTVTKLTVTKMGRGEKVTCNNYTKEADTTFYKSSTQISNLVYKAWFSRYPRSQYLYLTIEANSNFTSVPNAIHMALSISYPVSRTYK